jgi:hypothetical protein
MPKRKIGQSAEVPDMTDNEKGQALTRGSCNSLCMLSAHSLQKSRSTLQDFVLSIFMFHDLLMTDFLCFMDVLFFVEASLYEIDEVYEESLETSKQIIAKDGTPRASEELGDETLKKDALEAAVGSNEVLKNCITFLKQKGLFSVHVEEQFKFGIEYWALEQQLCSKLSESLDPETMILKAKRAISLKSFDYRVLHLLLYGLTGRPRQADLTEWLDRYVTLVEVEDDLNDYHKDICKNSFNIYRMFVRAYAGQAPDEMRAFIKVLETQYLELREKVGLSPALLARHMARNEQQSGPGPVMAPVNGRWQIPQPVLDEVSFRTLSAIRSVPMFVGGGSQVKAGD